MIVETIYMNTIAPVESEKKKEIENSREQQYLKMNREDY